jgi:hypothetical protein
VYGKANFTAVPGVRGENATSFGVGVYGYAAHANEGFGVRGEAQGDTDSAGVWGYHTGTGHPYAFGVLGMSGSGGIGVAGTSFGYQFAQTITGQWCLSAAVNDTQVSSNWVAYRSTVPGSMWRSNAAPAGRLLLLTTDWPEGCKLLNVYVQTYTANGDTLEITVRRQRVGIDANGKPADAAPSAGSMGFTGYTGGATGNDHTIDVVCSSNNTLSHGNGGAGDSHRVEVEMRQTAGVSGLTYIRGVYFKASSRAVHRWLVPFPVT